MLLRPLNNSFNILRRLKADLETNLGLVFLPKFRNNEDK